MTIFMQGQYSFPTLAIEDQVNGILIATILSGGGGHWEV